MKLLVVLPFCKSDCTTALKLVSWIIELGGCLENDCLLVASNSVSESEMKLVKAKADAAFRSSTLIQPPFALAKEDHPRGANWLFETACKLISGLDEPSPFLWLEADAVPTRAGWLDDIEKEYDKALKNKCSILSHVTTLNLPQFPRRIPSGISVYPADAWSIYKGISINRSVAWDVQFADLVMPYVQTTDLIFNFLNHETKPTWVSRRTEIMPKNAILVSSLPKNCVLAHPSHDGSLISVLRGDGEPTAMQLLTAWKLAKETQGCITEGTFQVRTIPPIKYIHAVERHVQATVEDEQRVLRAVNSWIKLYRTGRLIPCHVWDYPRDSREVSDTRALPFLKDILIEGMTTAGPNDVIVFTNDDTILHPRLLEPLDEAMKRAPAVGSFRLNFTPGNVPNGEMNLADILANGKSDLGRDLMAFKKLWLIDNWFNIPDFFVGELEFDLVLTAMIRRSVGVFTDRRNIIEPQIECEIPRGYVLHENHLRPWVSPVNKNAPAKMHNRRLAVQWYSSNGYPGLISNFS